MAKKNAYTELSRFRSIASPAMLYGNKEEALRVAEAMQGDDTDWTYTVNRVNNPTKELYEIIMTDEEGFSQRVSL